MYETVIKACKYRSSGNDSLKLLLSICLGWVFLCLEIPELTEEDMSLV